VPNTKQLTILIDKADTWEEGSLSEAIVQVMERNGLAGATVLEGIMGFGVHRRVHRKGLFGIPDEKPIAIIAIDEEFKLRSVLPTLQSMVTEGLITLQDVEIVSHSVRRNNEA
jgi:uncharacterized protein